MSRHALGSCSILVGVLALAGCGRDDAVSEPGGGEGAVPATGGAALGGTASDGGAAGSTASQGGTTATGGATTEGGDGPGGATTEGGDGAGGAASGGRATGGSATGGSATGGSADGGTSVGGSAGGGAPAGGAPEGGAAAAGTPAGGAAPGGAPTGGSVPAAGAGGAAPASGGGAGEAGADTNGGYLLEGVTGRIEVMVLPDGIEPGWSATATVYAQTFDGALRLDAFAPYPAALHEVALAEGDCTLLVAALRACDPICDWDQYCGEGDTCRTTPVAVDAGALELAGETGAVTLTYADGFYSQGELPATDVTGAVTATAAGAALPAFSVTTAGVGAPDFDLPEDGSLTLVDGEDLVITWTPTEHGVVQLLLNSGWHGAPPEATLVCEVPASEGRLVVPQAIVEAYPPESGFGLFPHSSYVTLFDRARADVGGGVVELVVGWRQGVYVLH